VGWGRVKTLPPSLLFVDTGLVGAGAKLAESVIKEAGIKLEEDKAVEGTGDGGTLKIVPYTVRQLSFGDIKRENVPGLYDGPFPWENMFGFHLGGMVGHDFFKPYAVTLDFQNMQIFFDADAAVSDSSESIREQAGYNRRTSILRVENWSRV